MKKLKKFCSILLACLLLGALCGCSAVVSSAVSVASASDAAASASHAVAETGIAPVTDLTIAEGSTALRDGTPVTVRLVMRYGNFLAEDEVALGGGFAETNYLGSCELQVWQGENRLSALALGGEAGVDTLYNELDFPLLFDDYNADGDPEFTVGQWASSASSVYSLFTIDESGILAAASAPYSVYASDEKSDSRYSVQFPKTSDGFTVLVYNNAEGVYQPVDYRWDQRTARFVPDE